MAIPTHLSLVGAARSGGRRNHQIALSILIVRARSVLLVATQRKENICWGLVECIDDLVSVDTIGDQVTETCRQLLGIQVLLTGSFDGFLRTTPHNITAHASLIASSSEDPILNTGAIWTENVHGRWFSREELASMAPSEFISERAYRLVWEWLVGGMTLIPHH